MIWRYSDLADDNRLELYLNTDCLFCRSQLTALDSPEEREEYGGEQGWVRSESTTAFVCPHCGWWKISKLVSDFPTKVLQKGGYQTLGAVSCLKQLDLSDVSLPLKDVQRFLLAKYESRYQIHPKLFEETVSSVFKLLGYGVEVTAYSNDGGIDIILNDGSSQIGVEVKRYKNKIQAKQIRELAGALKLKGITKGVFVTTSTFTRGATSTAHDAALVGCPIELLDANRFFSALKLTQKNMYESFQEFASEHPVTSLTNVDHLVAF